MHKEILNAAKRNKTDDMKKKCVQCGKAFEISEAEKRFFESKNLTLPKRCRECREKNKNSGNSQKNTKATKNASKYNSYYVKKDKTATLTTVILTAIVAIASLILKVDTTFTILTVGVALISLIKYILGLGKGKVFIQEFDTSIYKYTFYDTNSMVKHYVKHGEQTDSNSMEDYLYKANMVIVDKKSLTKEQKKDGDRIYYNNRTKEFVIIAKAGYVRTYFIASDKYYNKQ
jgi:hypothetical protein